MMISKVPGALGSSSLPAKDRRFVDRGASPVQLAVRGTTVPNGKPASPIFTSTVERLCVSINPSSLISTYVPASNSGPVSNNGARSGVRAWRPPV